MEIPSVNLTSFDLDPSFFDTNATFVELESDQGSPVTPAVVVISVIAVLGFIGNTVMLIALLMGYKRGWSNTDLFILNVIVIDLVVVSISAPLAVVGQAFPSFPLGESGCKAVVYFPYFGSVAVPMGVLSLVLNAATQRVFRALCPRWVVYTALLFIWVVAIHVPIPAIVHATVTSLQTYGENVFVCWTVWPGDNKVYDTVIFALFYALPFLRIVRIAVRRQATGPAGPQEGRRTDILIIIMAALFVVMYLPFYVAHLCFSYGSGYDTMALISVSKVGQCLVYLNSALKPLLCACLYDRFRSAFIPGRGRDGLAGGTGDRGTELGSL
ncbi:PREDICTED: galanin receptor type 3-like [Branchiostoma belcheri]|uniref:Galanin receptor type 3-like n=1 Tax=Branchiostoma belcheri TaxID=7741 RepID=A0A6P4ZNF7_BRABE|nr:PREDICTED: galanin receptor type 3-like [Branchiostoma belcheri]